MVDEFTFKYDGRSFHCRAESAGVSVSGRARPSNANWIVEVDGVSSTTFPADHSDTEASVKARVIEWYNTKRRG